MTEHDPRISTYLRLLGWALAPLPREDRESILAETAAHLEERRAEGDAALDAALEGFGPPEDYARAFVEEYRLIGAVGAPGPLPLLREALAVAGKSVLGFFGALFFGCLYLTSLGFLAVALLKPVLPEQTGLFVGEDLVTLGVVDAASAAGAEEYLGYWVIPIALAGSILVYVVTTRLLRRFLRNFLRRRRGEGS